MFRFFRQIRIRSLSESRFMKYILYAMGEILLVVIGILIALTINNNNDFRKDRIAEKALLENLIRDLERDQQELEMITTVNEGYMRVVDTVLREINFNPHYEIADFVRHIASFPFYGVFAISKGTYIETLSSGRFSLILTDSLKLQISNYYEVYYNYLGPDKIIVPLMKDLTADYNEIFSGTQEYAMVACGIPTLFPKIDISAISGNPKFHRILTQKYTIMNTQIMEWKRFMNANETLRNSIRNEIISRFE